jgi:hypothetical protein
MNQETTTELAVISTANEAKHLMQHAASVADVAKQIVTATAIQIAGRKYVKVEGWQAIATAYGCIASADKPERIETGYQARGVVRRISDGVILATGFGFVGDDETLWAERPEYARRAQCQTRAISRACRSAFAFVVVLMKEGLETTPAEEMDGVTGQEKQNRTPRANGNGNGHRASGKLEQVTGHVSRTWPNDFQGKRYYFAKLGDGRQIQTLDETLGEQLLQMQTGHAFYAWCEPSPKPGKLYLKRFAEPEPVAVEVERLPADDQINVDEPYEATP